MSQNLTVQKRLSIKLSPGARLGRIPFQGEPADSGEPVTSPQLCWCCSITLCAGIGVRPSENWASWSFAGFAGGSSASCFEPQCATSKGLICIVCCWFQVLLPGEPGPVCVTRPAVDFSTCTPKRNFKSSIICDCLRLYSGVAWCGVM